MISRHVKLLKLRAGLAAWLLALGIVGYGEPVNVPPLSFKVNSDGSYSVFSEALIAPVLRAGIAAKVDGRWFRSAEYPTHAQSSSTVLTTHGEALQFDVRFSGCHNCPDIAYRLLSHRGHDYGAMQIFVSNTTALSIHVEDLRIIDSVGPAPQLGAAAEQNRVLSDSFSEDTPAIRVRSLADTDAEMHRGVGSQLIYNRRSGWSFFAGALSSDRFLTLLRLHLDGKGMLPGIESYAVDCTGTTEITRENSLLESPEEDRVEFAVQVAPGAAIASERLFVSVDSDYHRQLEEYGALIRDEHHARITAPPLLGWWSWTAHYYGLNEGAALTNALWLKDNLAAAGFTYFHLDEGYQYARGEYTTSDVALFPHGVRALEETVRSLGLTPGLWTAPFEVSERSYIFQQHQNWLVKNALGNPIHLGWANNHHDRLYALDTTNPEAQEYLRRTYATLAKDWGIRYIKLDFMDDSCVEGFRYRPGTTALEAQRIGLKIIRDAIGDAVQLDKDGSPMLNPVGYVDYGRVGQDTGHTFAASKEAAPAIAARYYMNRTFFVNDPDAFTVSEQTLKDHPWNGGVVPLTLNEAKVSIALSAISGGMFEVGDDLPTLGKTPDRLALVTNNDLLDMVHLGIASTPVDLMTYDDADEQPSLFLLKESPGQHILTVFNWTDHVRTRSLSLSSLGLTAKGTLHIADIFSVGSIPAETSDVLAFEQPAHSVAMFKIIDPSSHLETVIALHLPRRLKSGDTSLFSADSVSSGIPVLSYHWDFGDGTSGTGREVHHTYTAPGTYDVRMVATGIGGAKALASGTVVVEGEMPSVFDPSAKLRAHAD